MSELGWLAQSVDVPLWGVLVLAGFQEVTRLVRREVGRRRGDGRKEGER